MPITIRNRWSGEPIRTVEAETLRGANLYGANLYGANLCGADLCGADLCGVRIGWQSHAIIAEILRRAAGEDVEKRKVAGLILVSEDWCWDRFLALRDPLTGWALDTLAPYVREGDDAPELLRKRAAVLKPAAPAEAAP